MQKKKVLFRQDNEPCHNSTKTMVKLNKFSQILKNFKSFCETKYAFDCAEIRAQDF